MSPHRCAAIDDDRNFLELISCYLAEVSHGMQILKFGDARTALDTLKHEHVDLVVTDLRMPGLDGVGFIVEFRRFDKTTPIMVVSSDEKQARVALARGATAFVAKHALRENLARTATTLLDRSAVRS